MPAYHEASPVSRRDLESLGWQIRTIIGCTEDPWLPVTKVVEKVLPTMFDGAYVFRVVDRAEMGERHGYADFGEKELVLRLDVYEGLVDNRGRDRMTAVHEVAHIILHDGQKLARRMTENKPPAYRDPEWQAKCLAGTMMMPERMVLKCRSVEVVSQEFGVSIDAASCRLRQLGIALPPYER